MYSFNIFYFYIISFSLSYLAPIFGKDLYRWVNSEAYLEPSPRFKIELFAKIVNN